MFDLFESIIYSRAALYAAIDRSPPVYVYYSYVYENSIDSVANPSSAAEAISYDVALSGDS